MSWYNPAVDSPLLMFKALGDPTRARIFEFLCSKCSPVALDESDDVRPVQGVTVGEVCCHITGSEQFSSTVSFHIKELRLAGLINAEKNGKFMVCSLRREAIDVMRDYLDRQLETLRRACTKASPQASTKGEDQ
ncbi:MAG: helix-turn-helix transcriptional regulator [Fimbriimonadaceae bacterium]|nr:helix-turn-helix transcriptional regulator [Fimbriimonadaceae bacterium]QYK54970.1 MAG: helix-turn-helix transcriptional regulator [Fimbriimonadaceae bacterium]